MGAGRDSDMSAKYMESMESKVREYMRLPFVLLARLAILEALRMENKALSLENKSLRKLEASRGMNKIGITFDV